MTWLYCLANAARLQFDISCTDLTLVHVQQTAA